MARRCSNCGGKNHYSPTCSKKASKKSKASKAPKAAKRGSIRRYSTGSTTRSQQGRSWVGAGSGWVVLYHGGRTKDTLHDKTWAVRVIKKGSGWAVVTRHGRRTGQKNETARRPTSKDAAVKAANSLVRQKLAKGYMFAGRNS